MTSDEDSIRQEIKEVLKLNLFSKRERQIIIERFDLDKEISRSWEDILEAIAKELGIPHKRQVKILNLSDLQEVEQILALQKASYSIEAALIGFDDLPPLKDTAATLQSCGETFYGYFVESELVGAIAYKRAGTLLDIHRMMVAPNFFRRGIAGKLLKFVQEKERDATRIIVQTGAKNDPAKNLYVRYGFTEIEQIEVVPGLYISKFEKAVLILACDSQS
jgi:ribosomal protein S18 acetylase RimI-like enzyme